MQGNCQCFMDGEPTSSAFCYILRATYILKSICVHLRPRISAITSSILDQFQTAVNYPRILMIFFMKCYTLPVQR